MPAFRAAVRTAVLAAVLQLCTTSVSAQESAYADLDACTKNEQIKLTAKGAMIGALAGLGGAFLSGKKDKALKATLVGAVGGGGVGLATAFYTAIDTCRKLNPNWISESSLVRDPGKSYAQVKKEHRYSASEGTTLHLRDMAMPSQARAGENIAVESVYDVLTPDGAEANVVFSRKLFVVTGGVETPVTFPMAELATRTVEAGRSKESLNLPIPGASEAGTVYRVELSASAGGKAPVTMTKSVTII